MRIFVTALALTMSSTAFAQTCPDFSGHHEVESIQRGKTFSFDLAQVGCESWMFSNEELTDEKGNVTKFPDVVERETDGRIHSDQYYGGHDRYCMKWLNDGTLQEFKDTETSTCEFLSFIWTKDSSGRVERIATGCVRTGTVLNYECRGD